ncbi:NAD-dependent epimerase/dehydratase family protein [Pseudomonas sp. N040]|uniref:NAD-dependent epimerase/dehydratase family protein n=1 Tax=Pseudomonas sp. N040 TaxID=2785325 RepID=UPI0018A2828D|nr:NAD-dependent epimerase/dehydratase family protein [Pseudomonas sp. N040]MBF7731537.1 NAD-dependent epimerase/dehydratase family protein [Pseudomonas sp. N040]MBW7015181.1 NAD-dependent epimerase/dehydratase family protein [Pseudomonas sp. N040]
MARSAFVTGSTGFVGLNLVQKLKNDGWDVTALHRASSDLGLLSRFSPNLAQGEITDAASILKALPNGIDTLFHVAGNTSMWRQGNAQQTRDNVEGTRNVVEAALAKGVRRLVVTSSISAYGPVSGAITEETPSLAASSTVNYELSKWQAQEIARAAMARGLEVVIMQPGAIMGPYDIGTWSRLFPLVRDGKMNQVPRAGLTFAHVREVVGAHVAAADKGENGGQYLLGGENRSMLELVRCIEQLLGKPAKAREVPGPLLTVVAAVSDFISNFTGKEPALTPEMAKGFAGSVTITAAKAQRELGFRIVPLEEMVRDCYDWMVAEGRI